MKFSVELVNISKSFGGVKVLDNVSIKIPEKSVTSILGPSGAGKTTLLKIIAGLIEPDEGRVYINGVESTHKPPWTRNIAMVFQSPALIPTMTGLENICLPLKKCDKSAVKDIVEMLNIEHVLNKYPEQMSGGEQQRVSIARALVTNPEVLLLDEPFAHLDALIKEHLIKDLIHLFNKLRITVIHVTHDQDEALTISDYLGIMSKGRIVEFGKSEEVYNKPKTSLGAKFLRHNFATINGRIYRFPPEAVVLSSEGEFSGTVIGCFKKRGYWLVKIVMNKSADLIECAYYKKINVGTKVRFDIIKELMIEA